MILRLFFRIITRLASDVERGTAVGGNGAFGFGGVLDHVFIGAPVPDLVVVGGVEVDFPVHVGAFAGPDGGDDYKRGLC